MNLACSRMTLGTGHPNRIEEFVIGQEIGDFQNEIDDDFGQLLDVESCPDSLVLLPVLLPMPASTVGPVRWERHLSLAQFVTTTWLALRDFSPFLRAGSMLPPKGSLWLS